MFNSLKGAADEWWTQTWKPKICSYRAGAFWLLGQQPWCTEAAQGTHASLCLQPTSPWVRMEIHMQPTKASFDLFKMFLIVRRLKI